MMPLARRAFIAVTEDTGHVMLNDNPEALLLHLRRWLRSRDI